MYVTKTISIELCHEEMACLKNAQVILGEICETFGNDCEACPFHSQCCEKGSPANLLYHNILALKEREE